MCVLCQHVLAFLVEFVDSSGDLVVVPDVYSVFMGVTHLNIVVV